MKIILVNKKMEKEITMNTLKDRKMVVDGLRHLDNKIDITRNQGKLAYGVLAATTMILSAAVIISDRNHKKTEKRLAQRQDELLGSHCPDED